MNAQGQEKRRAALASQLHGLEPLEADRAEVLRLYEAVAGEPFLTDAEMAAEASERKVFDTAVASAKFKAGLRAKGWLSLAECATELGFRSWTFVLSWVDTAPAIQVTELSDRSLSKGSRAGLMPDGLAEVRRRYEAFMGEAHATDAAANAAADAEYERLKQEAADRKAEQERKQAEWKADHQRRRAEAEKARQERLEATHAAELKQLEIDHARWRLCDLIRMKGLARQQFESTATPDARAAFFASRIGEQNYEYAATKYEISRAWARGMWLRYEERVMRAMLVLADLTGPAPTRDERIAAVAADWRGRTLRRGANSGKPRLDAFRAVTGYPDITKEERNAQEGATT